MRPVPWIVLVLLLASCSAADPSRDRQGPFFIFVDTPAGDAVDSPAPQRETAVVGQSAHDRAIDDAENSPFVVPGVRPGPLRVDIACAVPEGYERVDAAELLANPSLSAGMKVAVGGGVTSEPIFTLMQCPPVADCCNTMGTRFLLAVEGGATDAHIPLTGLGCGVYQCACNAPQEGRSLVLGTVDPESPEATIIVDSVCMEPNP